jgi:hypothetical protein
MRKMKQGSSQMTDVLEIFLRVRRADIAYIKFLIESYEGVGIIRTLDRHAAIIVLLAAPDFAAPVRGIIAAIQQVVPCVEIPRPPVAATDWLLQPESD